MKQFTIQYKGTSLFSGWSQRTLTIDPVNHLAYISDKKKPEVLAADKFRLTQVTLWPYYSTDIMKKKEKHSSKEERLTVGIEGLEEKVTEEDKKNLENLETTPAVQVAAKVPTRHQQKRPIHLIRFDSVDALSAFVDFAKTMADPAASGEAAAPKQEGEEGEEPSSPSAAHVANHDTLGGDFHVTVKGTVEESQA